MSSPTTSGGGRVLLARRWSWVLVLVVGVVLYEAIRRVLVETANPNLVPALILIGAAVVPAAFVAFIAGRRLVFTVHTGLVIVTALLGGVVGVVAAGLVEYRTLQRLGVLPIAGVGVIEEAAKLIVPLVVVLVLRRDRHPADGLLIGVASGAGFAVLETMGYAFVALIESQGNVAVVQAVLFERGALSPAAHMAWTGLSAAALWHAAIAHWRPRAVGWFVLVFVVAVALHTAWDSAPNIWVDGIVAVVSLALLWWTAHRLAAPHRRQPVVAAPAVPAAG
jgi:RsiW-degrading membrane proteinase PrsW (M82 family)